MEQRVHRGGDRHRRRANPVIDLLRFAVAGVLLTVLALVSKSSWPKGKLLLHVVVTGLLMQAVQFGALTRPSATGCPAAWSR
ncbi:hypothetical protein SHKM778_04340 [Streptomyces sp. KM77-8]|uniref:Uncharacterized protein n=1 Tax=Streptomyces haneummycinicus TaxID=3074435 RepID=A0AAT9H9K1_9ACTN